MVVYMTAYYSKKMYDNFVTKNTERFNAINPNLG